MIWAKAAHAAEWMREPDYRHMTKVSYWCQEDSPLLALLRSTPYIQSG